MWVRTAAVLPIISCQEFSKIMSTKQLSISEFRREVSAFRHFRLVSTDPSRAEQIDMGFREILVCTGCYPVIALKNDTGHASLRYISSVARIEHSADSASYLISCEEVFGKEFHNAAGYRILCSNKKFC